MNALAYQADPSSVTTERISPNRVKKTRVTNRAASIQSSLDPYVNNYNSCSIHLFYAGISSPQILIK